MVKTIYYTCCIFLFISFGACQNDASKQESSAIAFNPDKYLFKLLSNDQTNIDFVNSLDEGLNTNVLVYEYFYNGGGVATGDFNGDDLVDIYFTSNMGENRLYLNKGNLTFEDISLKSGASGRPGPWKTGVTIVDVNGDKKLDIYLCYSGALPDKKRENQLFINQGNNENGVPIFIDEAEKWGLNSSAFSNQAYFFDYDRDSDLDMLLLNHNPKSLPILNEASTAKYLSQDDKQRGVRLFQQNNNKFTDVTRQAGISGSALTYGLGIGISDLNQDGWPDFYVSNDYAVPDYLYINDSKGGFTNQLSESVRYNSQFSMGNDIADINNDDLSDIVTLDMLPEDKKRQRQLIAPDNYAKFDVNVRNGFYYQFMRNMLQLNNGNGTFSEIGQQANIAATDWSWAALLADYNNDGWKDLYVTNGYHRDYTNLDFISYMDDYVQEKGRLQRDDVLKLIEKMPASDVVNYMYANNKDLTFSNRTSDWGLNHPANSNGAAYADLDNDGDLDLVTNNINKPAFIYENISRDKLSNHFIQIKLHGAGLNTNGIGAKLKIYSDDGVQSLEQFQSRGYLSAVSSILHFGCGEQPEIDSISILWPTGKFEIKHNIQVDQRIGFYEKDAKGTQTKGTASMPIFSPHQVDLQYENPKSFVRDFDRQSLLISELSHQGPCMAKSDVNGDGLEDILIGGSSGQSAQLFMQDQKGQFKLKTNESFVQDRRAEDTDIAFFDANGDGIKDVYISSGGYHFFKPNDPLLQDRLYLNDGKGVFTKNTNALPIMPTSKSTIAVADINNDGLDDLFVGGRVIPGKYPQTPNSYMLINDGRGNFTNQIESYAPSLSQIGMVTDAVWADMNGDHQKDLVVVGEWMNVKVFVRENDSFIDQSSKYFDQPISGLWNTIATSDFNGDGRPDFIFGNIGNNLPFKVSIDEPAELYFSDFDKNGSVDPILNFYINGTSYPYLTRDELLGQIASFKSQYTSYESYAGTKMTDLFASKQIESAEKIIANQLNTSLFVSSNSEMYQHIELPSQVQYAPISAIQILDYNQDGNDDLILCGNNSHTRLRMGHLNANYGILLKGRGNGQFDYIDQEKSGLNIKGDVKSILQIDQKLIFGINQEKLSWYQLN